MTIHLSREGNWLQKGNNWVKLYNKREAARAAMSFDPDLLIAYVNSSFQESNEEVGEADLLQQGQAERKLRSLTHPEKVLCRNRNIYQWGDSRAAICDVRPTKEERA